MIIHSGYICLSNMLAPKKDAEFRSPCNKEQESVRYLVPQPTQYQQCIWRFINISQTFMAAQFCVHTRYINVNDGLKILDPSSSACHEIARHHIVHNRPQQNGVPNHKGWKFYNPTTKRTAIPECAVFDERYFLGLKNWSSVPAFCSHLLPSF